MQTCLGLTSNLHRCKRTRNSWFFCHDHKYQWLAWLFTLIFTVGGGSASLFSTYQNIATQEHISELKDLNKQEAPPKFLHVTPGDFNFDLLSMRDTEEKTHIYTVALNIVARKDGIYLKKKAKVESFNLEERYFFDTEFKKDFKLVNISLKKYSLKSKHDSTEVILSFDPEFVFVNPRTIVYDAERLVEHRVGNINARLFFDYEENEHSVLVEIPIVFSSSNSSPLQ